MHAEYFSHVFVPGSESEQHEHLISFFAGALCVGFLRFSFDFPVSFRGFPREGGVLSCRKWRKLIAASDALVIRREQNTIGRVSPK